MKFLVVLLAIGFVHAGVLNSKSDNNVFKGTYGFFLPGHKNATNIIGVKDIYAPESNEITITFPETGSFKNMNIEAIKFFSRLEYPIGIEVVDGWIGTDHITFKLKALKGKGINGIINIYGTEQ